MIDVATHIMLMKQKRGMCYRKGNCYIEIAESGHISIDEEKKLLLDCSWLKEDPLTTILAIRAGASLIVKDNFSIYSGAEIFVNKNAELVLGSGYINNHFNLHCFKRIEIGGDVAIADHVTIRDSDSHLFNGNTVDEMTKPISIGDHVWIGTGAIILKGVHIGNGSVIAAGAVVTKNIPAGCLAGGVPARVLQTGVVWE